MRLFSAHIVDWPAEATLAFAELKESLGMWPGPVHDNAACRLAALQPPARVAQQMQSCCGLSCKSCFALRAGESGDVHAETLALLTDFGVATEPFTEEVLACLPPTVWLHTALVRAIPLSQSITLMFLACYNTHLIAQSSFPVARTNLVRSRGLSRPTSIRSGLTCGRSGSSPSTPAPPRI